MISNPLHVRIARSAAAGLLVASAAVLGWPSGPALAESPDTVGWWNRARPDTPDQAGDFFVDPYDTPNGGFAVANGSEVDAEPPAGLPVNPAEVKTMAFGALRFEATRARKATLTLKAPEGDTFPQQASLSACPVLGSWDQQVNGAWDSAPERDCLTIASPGEFNDERTEVKFKINEEYFRLGVLVNTIEMAVVPTPGHAVPFELTFARPGFDALVADGPLIEPPGLAPGGGGVAPPPTFPPADTGGGGFTPGDTGGGFVSPPPTDPTGNVSVDDPAFTSTTLGRSATDDEVAAAVPASDTGNDRLLAAAVLALMAGGLFLATSQDTREPKLIGGLANHGTGDDVTE